MTYRSADRTNRLSRALTSARIGVIDRVRERRTAAERGGGFDFVSEAAHPSSLPADLHAVYGGGSPHRCYARAAAIGEAVERYALSAVPNAARRLRAITDVPDAACTLSDLQWFLEEQYAELGFPFLKPESTWCYDWVTGHSLLTSSPASMPSALVYLPYRAAPGELATSFQTSVGTSCADGRVEAAYRSVLELIERDALTICWESRAPFPPIEQEAVEASARAICGKNRPFRLRAFDLTTDLAIPVMLVLALARYDGPAVAIGTAADLVPKRALERAIAEAATSWRSAAFISARSKISVDTVLQPRPDRSAVIQHTLYYTRREGLRHFSFLLENSASPRGLSDCADGIPAADIAMQRCAECLRRAGYDVVLFDITPADIASTSLHVVRAVSPGLVRPTIGTRTRHLANPRIREVPYILGLEPAPVPVARLLNQVHPAP